MNSSLRRLVGMVAVLAMVAPIAPSVSALSVVPPGQGELIGVCWNGAVQLYWGTHPQANSNSIQKGDAYPNDPGNFWGWLVQGHSGYSYVDYNVVPGVTYSYRVKYRPDLPSNVVNVTCPTLTPTPTPSPLPYLWCEPSAPNVQSGQEVTFTAKSSYPYAHPALTWQAVGGHPSSGVGTSFATRFYANGVHETRVVSVSDGYRTVNCSVRVNGATPTPTPALSIYPGSATIDSGDAVTFWAAGGDGSYFWDVPHVSTTPRRGTSRIFTFHNYSDQTQAHTVTVRSGNQSRTATVWVRPHHLYPTPDTSLRCYPERIHATSGEEIILRATGYHYSSHSSWYAPSGSPERGSGATFATRFTNHSNMAKTYRVTVTNGYRTAPCDIIVAPSGLRTPTPTPYEHELVLAQSGRNISDGQTGYTASVRAGSNDTVQFLLTVTNRTNETMHDVRVTDFLPDDFRYVWSSTTLDGRVVDDGITTSGLNIGTLRAGYSVQVRFSAIVEASAIPSYGTVTVYNTAQVRADDTDVQSSRMSILLGHAAYLSAASGVNTGIGGSVVAALIAALSASAVYGLYTRSTRFEKRYALARVRLLAGSTRQPNFLG